MKCSNNEQSVFVVLVRTAEASLWSLVKSETRARTVDYRTLKFAQQDETSEY